MLIGYGSDVPAEFVRLILHPANPAAIGPDPVWSAPLKRLIDRAEAEGRLVRANKGRRTRAVIITDSNHVVLSGVSPETLKARFQEERRYEMKPEK